MANINPKDIENTAKSVFNENFNHQAMNVIEVPKDIMREFTINCIKFHDCFRDFQTANGVRISFRKK